MSGRAHQRLTPSNCDDLSFDDVRGVDNAKCDHFDFEAKMRDRGIVARTSVYLAVEGRSCRLGAEHVQTSPATRVEETQQTGSAGDSSVHTILPRVGGLILRRRAHLHRATDAGEQEDE